MINKYKIGFYNGLLENIGCFAWKEGKKRHGLFRITVRNTDMVKIKQIGDVIEYLTTTEGIIFRAYVSKTHMVWHLAERTSLMKLIEYFEANLLIPKKNQELVKQKLIECGVLYKKWNKNQKEQKEEGLAKEKSKSLKEYATTVTTTNSGANQTENHVAGAKEQML